MSERQKPPYDFSKFHDSRFQPIPGYEDIQRAPYAVVSQTDLLLRLYSEKAIRQPEIARGYLKEYALGFLDATTRGVARVFTKDKTIIDAQPLDINEAADFTNVVFAWMHYFATSRLLPNGFSRRGMLQAPTTRKEFVQRTTEIKRELAFIVAGLRDHDMPLETNPSSLRTHTFFHVGAIIPLKFPDSKRELEEKEKEVFDRLLGNTNIDLP